MNIRGTRILLLSVREYQCLGYESINIRGTRVIKFGVREYKYLGYEGIDIRYEGIRGRRVSGTRVSEVHGYQRYESIRGRRVSDVRGYQS